MMKRFLGILVIFSLIISFNLSMVVSVTATTSILLYDLDFSSPPHSVGFPPVTGAGPPPRETISSIHFDAPIVVSSFGALTDQPLEFNSFDGKGDQIDLNLSDMTLGDHYVIEAEIVIAAVETFGRPFKILLDTPQVRTVSFQSDGGIYVFVPISGGSGQIGTFTFNSKIDLRIEVNLAEDLWMVYINGVSAHSGSFGGATQIRSVRFSTSVLSSPGGGASAAIDNVRISVVLVEPPSEVWVDDDFTPGTPGWGTTHFDKIQDGIDAVDSPGIVHVAAGTYLENISLKDGVHVLGAGACVTTIDGNRNKCPVVIMADNSIIRGFRISGGNLDECNICYFRCAIRSMDDTYTGRVNVEISQNIIEGNCSALCAAGSNLLLRHNLILNNIEAGCELHTLSSALIENNVFAGNGVALELHRFFSGSIINNTIVENGNGIELSGGTSPDIRNNIVANNIATGINNVPEPLGSPTLCNNDVWGNGIDYRNLVPGPGDISADPMFVDLFGGDYHLQTGSPCIDTGTNVGAPIEDIEGNPRPIDGDRDSTATTDIGAYEYIPLVEPVIEATIDFNPNTLNLKSRGNWITCRIRLPEDYDIQDIDISTVMLNEIVPAEWGNVQDGTMMVKFNRSDVQDILSPGNEVEVTISGELADGTLFEGTDIIRVIEKGKSK